MKRFTRTYAAELYVAQQTRRDGRAGDYLYATAEGNAQAEVDTSMPGARGLGNSAGVGSSSLSDDTHAPGTPFDPRVAPQLTLLELRTLHFRLPQPCSVNELYGTNHTTGQKFLLPAQKQFRATVIGIVKGTMLRAEQRDQPLLGRLRAQVLVSDRLDIDNGLKSLLDGLQHAKAYRNDRQIRRLEVDSIEMPQGREYCDVTLQEIGA